ncbi:MAG TPA: DUF1802 family protein [Candidatus Binatia bacterium]|jgi:hypothetical protein|nr:DUF1802 family protein [Candidatus Binatia bacterium]
MQPGNSLALKEWAVVVHALGSGKQLVLLRKGGLHERRGHFATEPREFFLFPTYVHQMAQGVVSGAAADLRAVMESRPAEDHLVISYYASVEDLVWLDTHECLAALADWHCWTPETVRQRFTYGTRAGLHLFVLRVSRLPHPHILPLLKRYGGCRSWVDLAEPLSTAGATPVVSEAVFAERIRQMRDRLSLPSSLPASA